jgi:hypothetical protein
MEPIDSALVGKIRYLHEAGYTRRRIAKICEVSPTTVEAYTVSSRKDIQGRPNTGKRANPPGICDCGHALDQHWLHGCRAAVAVQKHGRQEMDICTCKRPQTGNPWTIVNCYHCEYLKKVPSTDLESLKTVISPSGERVEVGGEHVSRAVVTCVLDNWEGFAFMQTMERALHHDSGFFRSQAIDCADFADMRPRLDEIYCEYDMCQNTTGLAYNLKGRLMCSEHS